MEGTRWEHRTHEFPPGLEQVTTQSDYFMAVCPACEFENTLLCVVDGKIHMKQELKCTACHQPLPYGKELADAAKEAVKSGPPVGKKASKKVAVEAPPPPDIVIDPATKEEVIQVEKLIAAQKAEDGKDVGPHA